MFLAGEIAENDWGGIGGLINLRLFENEAAATRWCMDQTEVTTIRRDDAFVTNPQWNIYQQSRPYITSPLYRAWHAVRPPFQIPNPNPQPYNEYIIENRWVVLRVNEGNLTIPMELSENGEHVLNSLFTFDLIEVDDKPRLPVLPPITTTPTNTQMDDDFV